MFDTERNLTVLESDNDLFSHDIIVLVFYCFPSWYGVLHASENIVEQLKEICFCFLDFIKSFLYRHCYSKEVT